MTGWRVGWLIGPADVIKAATNLQSHATTNVANVAQAAALAAVTGDLAAVGEMRDGVRPAPADDLRDAHEIPGVMCPEPQGAFYVSRRQGRARPDIRGRTPTTAPSSPSWCSRRPRSRRARRGLRRARLRRLSYALGDDDLARASAGFSEAARRGVLGWPCCWATVSVARRHGVAGARQARVAQQAVRALRPPPGAHVPPAPRRTRARSRPARPPGHATALTKQRSAASKTAVPRRPRGRQAAPRRPCRRGPSGT